MEAREKSLIRGTELQDTRRVKDMIKKTLFVGAAVLLLAVLFFGRGAVSYVTTAVDRVQDQVKSNVPVKFEIERARNMIKDLDPEIARNMHLIAREEVEIAKLQRELDKNEKQLAKSQGDILRLKGDLESGNTQFVYAGRSYTAFEVKTDLANRFAHHKTAEATVDQLEKILRARENGLKAAQDKLEAMMAAKRQLAVEIENLEARLKMVEVAQTTSQFNFDDSQLARTRDLINEISTRLDVTEKMMSQQVELSDRIPLEEDEADTENVLDAVTRHFEKSASEQPQVAELANTASH
jgi:Skp family chaperone for outer membrane proteins